MSARSALWPLVYVKPAMQEQPESCGMGELGKSVSSIPCHTSFAVRWLEVDKFLMSYLR